MLLSPSLLSADFSRLAEELHDLEAAGVTWLHLDVMDGLFVPNITFGPPVLGSIRPLTRLFFDVHLMIRDPGRYVEDFARCGADLLVIHAESETHTERTLAAIRSCGMKAGVAFNPGTDLAPVRWLIDQTDLVLIMGVNPGFSGQKFIPRTLEKVGMCRSLLDELHNTETVIEVDGGVTAENAPALVAAGADVLVSGSSFFGHKPYDESLARFPCSASQGPAATWRTRSTPL